MIGSNFNSQVSPSSAPKALAQPSTQLTARQAGDSSSMLKQSPLYALTQLEVLVKSSINAMNPLQPFVLKSSLRASTQYKPMDFWKLVNLKKSFGVTPSPRLSGKFSDNYTKKSEFGKTEALPATLSALKEPLRLRVSPDIFNRQKAMIVELATGSKDAKMDLQDPQSYAESKSYKSTFFKGGGPRSEGITGKYYDAMTVHQNAGGDPNSDYVQSLGADAGSAVDLINWFNNYSDSLSEMHQNIAEQVQTLFPQDESFQGGFLFQNNPPFRLHEPGNAGTPAHQDTASIDTTKNRDSKGDSNIKEIVQDDHIFNAWIPYHGLLLGDEAATLSIAHTSPETDGETGFIPCLKDVENEVFIFQAGQNMHKGQFNSTENVRISNDVRFIPAQKYLEKEGIFKKMTGPANNKNVCFCVPKHKKEGQFHVFSDTVFGNKTPELQKMQVAMQDTVALSQ